MSRGLYLERGRVYTGRVSLQGERHHNGTGRFGMSSRDKYYTDLKAGDIIYFPQENIRIGVESVNGGSIDLKVGEDSLSLHGNETFSRNGVDIMSSGRRHAKNRERSGYYGRRVHVTILLPKGHRYSHTKVRNR